MEAIAILKTKMNGSEINSVDAREIYKYLDLVSGQFSRWIRLAIEKYDFIENQDYVTLDMKVGATNYKNYIVSLDMAKELCMVSDTEKGKSTRKYFISIEKQINRPLSFEEMAKQTILLADKRIKELEHKVSTLTHASKLYTSSEIAKELGFKSAIELNKKLNEDGIQYKQNNTWLLYSKYSSRGFVSIKQDILDSGRIIYDRKWTGIGRDFLIENYLKVA